jgi:transposase InsO family protein
MFPRGAREAGLRLVSDNGCQPTSKSFMESCHILGIMQIFASYSNQKGNADTERIMRTIKEGLVWTNEWRNQEEIAKASSVWVETYNNEYLHSSLGYLSPCAFETLEMERVVRLLQTETTERIKPDLSVVSL